MTAHNPRSTAEQEGKAIREGGAVRIAPEVLATIAALTARNVPGVVRLEGGFAGEVGKFIRRGHALEGVKINVANNEVWVELHLVVKPDVSMYQTGREVQDAVANAVEMMVGMPVHAVDVYIEDVE